MMAILWRNVALLTLALFCTLIFGFRKPPIAAYSYRATALSAGKVEIFAKNLVLTEPLKERIEGKIGKVVHKLGKDSLWAHVVLKVLNQPLSESHSQLAKRNCHIAEVTVGYKGGAVVHACERTDDMYSSIDLVAHKLAHSMRKHHEKLVDKTRKSPTSAYITTAEADVSPMPELDEEEDLVRMDKTYENIQSTQPEQRKLKVVKQKLFSMPPISVDEAMTALELIDHPFYMFRNKATNEINLVYRREAGGVGHIVPKSEG